MEVALTFFVTSNRQTGIILCKLKTTDYRLPTLYYLLQITDYQLFTTYYLLPTTYSLPLTSYLFLSEYRFKQIISVSIQKQGKK